jgi:transcriptional regulator with XRE-family HTH domain
MPVVATDGTQIRTMNLEARERLASFVTRARGKRSRRAFARVLDVSNSAIQDWETLKSVPDTNNLKKIARSGGLTLEQLLEYLTNGTEPRNSNLESVLKLLEVMPLSQVAEVAQAACTRLASECVTF